MMNEVEKMEAMMQKYFRRNKYHLKLKEIEGYQNAVIELSNVLNDYKTSNYRKTIDVDDLQEILLQKLKDNKEDMREIAKSYQELDKVVNISEWRA